ncbi:MAG: hypothetical protein JWP17_2031 [Solirubrobacterales bacterium]|nr:hypothetical protein [Solirubrobacterales bacterium]
MHRLVLTLAATVLVALAFAVTAEATSKADLGIWGYAVRQPIKRGETTQLKFVIKNNGPSGGHRIYLQATVPYQLQMRRWKLYGGLGCTVKGTFIKCRMGAFALEQQGTLLITVRGRKRGTYVSHANVFATASNDRVDGNNEVGATIMVR